MQPITENVEEYLAQLGTVRIFQYLNDEERRDLLAAATLVRAEPEEFVIREGELSPEFYAVLDGSVNIMVSERASKDVFICVIGAGDVFGEAAIFLNTKRTASAVSNGAVLLRLEREALLRFIRTWPAAGIKILMLVIYSLLHKLREANQELAFERKASFNQDEVDALIQQYLK